MDDDDAERIRRPARRAVLRRAGWVLGAPLATFRFLSRDIVIEHVSADDAPAPLPAADVDPAHREQDQAAGPLVHRVYAAAIEAPTLAPERLVSIIAADLNVIAPAEVLRFERASDVTGPLREGDELRIRMAGPWDGPVRVTRRWERGLRLAATRDNAMLGQIELRAGLRDGRLVMEVQTRERPARRGFALLRRLGVVRRMQLHAWAEMLEKAAQVAGGRKPARITVRSWREG